MTRLWTIIGVRDVARSFAWYQRLLGQPATVPAHDYFGQILDADGTVLLCLHAWGEHDHPPLASPDTAQIHAASSFARHDHPPLASPDTATPGHGLLLFFRVDDFDGALQRARTLVERFEEEPHLSPNTGTMEFALRDPDGYYVMVSAAS